MTSLTFRRIKRLIVKCVPFLIENSNAVTCNLTELATGTLMCQLWSAALLGQCMHGDFLRLCAVALWLWSVFSGFFLSPTSCITVFFLFCFLIIVTGACLPCFMGAHGLVARISQPWAQSPTSCWLPIQAAPGCSRHLTST